MICLGGVVRVGGLCDGGRRDTSIRRLWSMAEVVCGLGGKGGGAGVSVIRAYIDACELLGLEYWV